MSCRTDASSGQTNALADELESSGIGPAVLASIGSVALALYYYYVKGDEQRGQFVGLWPGTILGMASYLKLARMEQESESATEESE